MGAVLAELRTDVTKRASRDEVNKPREKLLYFSFNPKRLGKCFVDGNAGLLPAFALEPELTLIHTGLALSPPNC
jgi:hypothetical protein